MPRFVALLRGINVGGHRIKMDRLRELFREVDLDDVATFIASGNVIFSSDSEDVPALTVRIEEHLLQKLGYEVQTFIRTPRQLVEVARFEPSGHEETRSLYILFLKAPASAAMRARFEEIDSSSDRFTFDQRELYWSIEGKISESPLFAKGLGKAIGTTPTTTRNATSVRKLVAKLAL